MEIAQGKSLDGQALVAPGGADGWKDDCDFMPRPDTGYISHNEPWSLVEVAIAEFRAGRMPFHTCTKSAS
jgi:hypothetical protein